MSSDGERERWQAVQALFDEVVDLPTEQQASFLDRACGSNAALRSEVAALLAADRRADRVLSGAAEAAAALLGEAAAERVEQTEPHIPELDRTGQRVGAFRIVREAGRGGMGTVYLAERADGQFEQRVAIKILKRGTDTDEVLRRFLRERQILANLKHPHIAGLVDGGVSPDGLPFFALEFVEGEPFTAYCATRRLRVEDRLRLFLDACGAVESAHRALIVHRDLKPSNILVTASGDLRLLDFGIAKLLDPEAEQGLTRTDLRLLTPQYAAPEQVRGEPVTTGTDVYALGLLLYELLTGERAQRPRSTDAKAVHEAVVETDAVRPSTAATSASGLQVGDLRRRLRGDLDRIVLKALQKEPERRYRSVDAFAEDVRRHLAGLPVAAQGDRVGYRVGKFVRRHRFAVAAAAMVLLALVGGLVATLWQARAARMQARRAEDVQKFLIGLFEVADPSESKGATVTARDLLMRGAERVDKELAAQPENRAQIIRTIARIQTSLGLYDEAIAQAEKALALDRKRHPGDDPAVADDLTILANALMQKTDFARAETIASEALALETRLHGPRSAEAASAESDLAAVRYEQGKFDEAERLNDEALAIRRARFGEDSLEVGYSFKALAEDYYKQGEYPKAEVHAREALARFRRGLGEEDPIVATQMQDLALYLGAQAKFDQAEPLFKQTIALRTKVLGAGHPDVAITQKELLNVYNRIGKWEESARLIPEILSTYKRAYGEKSPNYANAINDVAVIQYVHGDYQAAATTLRQALAIWLEALGEDHPDYLSGLNNLGAILREAGDYAAAEPALRRGLEIRIRTQGADHPDVALARNNLGVLERLSGRPAEAKKEHLQALAGYRAAEGENHTDTAYAMLNLGLDEAALGHPREAEPLMRQSLAIYRQHFPDGHPRIAEVGVGLGPLLVESGRAKEAEPLLREALALRTKRFTAEDWRTAEAQLELGRCLANLDKKSEARPLFESSAKTLLAKRGARDPLTLRAQAARAHL
ncbi:MAG: serine/threonine-protein kinase [Acidobacteriota bacterium]